MAVLPSIGTSVSFFYQIPTIHQQIESPLDLLTTNNHYALLCQQDTVLLHSHHVLSLPEGAAFPICSNSTTNVILLFGDGLIWTAMVSLFKHLSPDTAISCRLYQPHPELDRALELQLTQPLTIDLQQQLTDLAQRLNIELVYLSARPTLNLPGLLVMDMDSTAIQIECIDEIAKLAGVGEQVASVTARAMNGELDFAQSLTQRVAKLQGAPEQVLQQVFDAVPLMPGLIQLVAHLKAHNWQVAIASGGFTYFTDALKTQLNLTATFANVLEIADGLLTGKVLGDIVDANTKAQVVNLLAAQYHIDVSQTVAIGDGANDIPMLNAAALGVAFHAKPKVQAQAKAAIRQGSLLQLLYLLD